MFSTFTLHPSWSLVHPDLALASVHPTKSKFFGIVRSLLVAEHGNIPQTSSRTLSPHWPPWHCLARWLFPTLQLGAVPGNGPVPLVLFL